jgi:hypothetical protein
MASPHGLEVTDLLLRLDGSWFARSTGYAFALQQP